MSAHPKDGAAVRNVSDTARWVATYRAWESARPDAVFRDPYAARLAGEHGERIARSLGGFAGTGNGWPIVARTKLLDDLIRTSIAEGCTAVLNLAAGFDTRPYRMDLQAPQRRRSHPDRGHQKRALCALPTDRYASDVPALLPGCRREERAAPLQRRVVQRELPETLRWIEADMPAIVDEKQRALAGERPSCALERVRVDLADVAGRAAVLDHADAVGGGRVLVLTEGLTVYLDEDVVAGLARDLAARPTFAWWALDLHSPALLRDLQRSLGRDLVNAPMKFGPADGVTFFHRLGWRGVDATSLFHEAARLRRIPWLMRPFAWLPAPDPYAPGKERWAGVVRLARAVG